MELFIKKEINFSAKMDTAEFDRVIDQMQRKLEKMYAPADQMKMQSQTAGRMQAGGMGGGMSAPSQQEVTRATQQARRVVEQSLASEIRVQEKLSKEILNQQKLIENLNKMKSSAVKDSEQELNLIKSITRAESEQAQQRQRYRAQDQGINSMADARDSLKPQGLERLATAYSNGGMGGALKAGGRMLKNIGPGAIGSVLSGAGVALGVGGELYNSYKNAPINTASNYGSAMSGVLGSEVQNAYAGKSALSMAFLPEKQKSLKMAAEGMKGERVSNATGLAGSILGYAGAGAGAGAAYGGTAGALAGLGVASLPFAGIGATGGAIVGGIGGAAYGAYKGMTGTGGAKSSALVKGLVSETHNAEYESMMAKDFAGKYQQSLQGLKEQDPYKTASLGQYDESYTRYLDSQRSMGMSNGQFHGGDLKKDGTMTGGFRQKAIDAGFTDDMAMGASSSILSAGGSTNMAQNSVLALQASRNFNQTNSTGVLGQISGQLGGSQASQQAYVKMLAEGTRQGLDTSTYAEESRKMMEVQASALAKSGATSVSDVDRLVGQLGGFLAEKTNKGIQSSKDAFETYNQASGETGGPRGVLRAAGFMKDPVLGKMDALDRSSLSSMKSDQLSTDDPMIIGLATKYNTTPEKIIGSITNVNKNSMNFRKSTDEAQAKATSLKTKLDSMSPNDPDRAETQKQFNLAYGEYNVGIQNDLPGMSTQARKSFANAGITPGADMQKAMEDAKKIDTELNNKNTGKMEDTSVQGAAEGSRVVLDNFMKFKDQMAPAADAIRAFNVELAKTISVIQGMNASDKAKYMEKFSFKPAENQSQSGKSKQ